MRRMQWRSRQFASRRTKAITTKTTTTRIRCTSLVCETSHTSSPIVHTLFSFLCFAAVLWRILLAFVFSFLFVFFLILINESETFFQNTKVRCHGRCSKDNRSESKKFRKKRERERVKKCEEQNKTIVFLLQLVATVLNPVVPLCICEFSDDLPKSLDALWRNGSPVPISHTARETLVRRIRTENQLYLPLSHSHPPTVTLPAL